MSGMTMDIFGVPADGAPLPDDDPGGDEDEMLVVRLLPTRERLALGGGLTAPVATVRVRDRDRD